MLPNFLGKRKLFSEKKGIRLKFTRKVHLYFIDNKYFHRPKQYLKKIVFFFKKKHLSNLNLIIFAHCSLLHNFNFSIMNKTELINAMAEKSGMPKTQVKKALLPILVTEPSDGIILLPEPTTRDLLAVSIKQLPSEW